MRRQRLKSITILPSLVTILNGVFGFAAIVLASQGRKEGIGQLSYFALAAYMILLAMFADVLDGRLARMSKSTSSFGGQLDSLCDMISFGVAPAFLMLKVLEYELAVLELTSPNTENFVERFVWLAAAVYVSCAAIRLARFNVENEEDESAHMSFIGLPTPAAAGVIMSLVIFHQEALPQLSAKNSDLYNFFDLVISCVLPVLAVGVAVLMVSRIRYPHVVNQYIKGRKPFAHLVRLLLGISLIIWSRPAALLLIFCAFAASGFVKWFYLRILKRTPLIPNGDDTVPAVEGWTAPGSSEEADGKAD